MTSSNATCQSPWVPPEGTQRAPSSTRIGCSSQSLVCESLERIRSPLRSSAVRDCVSTESDSDVHSLKVSSKAAVVHVDPSRCWAAKRPVSAVWTRSTAALSPGVRTATKSISPCPRESTFIFQLTRTRFATPRSSVSIEGDVVPGGMSATRHGEPPQTSPEARVRLSPSRTVFQKSAYWSVRLKSSNRLFAKAASVSAGGAPESLAVASIAAPESLALEASSGADSKGVQARAAAPSASTTSDARRDVRAMVSG